MHQLIEAALEHAEYLRECALGSDHQGQRVERPRKLNVAIATHQTEQR